MDLDSAVAKHSEWKTRFRSAIMKQETLDATTIAKDNCCELGKWLHSDAKRLFGSLPSLSECINKHAAFHVEAGKVAKTINEKRYTDAEKMMEHGTPYLTASSAVGLAIVKLKRDAKL